MRSVGMVEGFGPVRVEIEQQGGDDYSRTADTVSRMERAIARGSRDSAIIHIADSIRAQTPYTDEGHLLDAAFDWIRANVSFQPDPPEDELLIEPGLLVRLPRPKRRGDCDDFTMLAGALLSAIGYSTRVVTIRADRRDPDRFSHVFLEVDLLDGSAVPFDASHGREAGWRAPFDFGEQKWERIPPGGNMSGLGQAIPIDVATISGQQPYGAWWQQILSTGLRIGERIGTATAQTMARPPGTMIAGPEGQHIQYDIYGMPYQPRFGRPLPWLLIGAVVIGGVLLLSRRKGGG